MAGGGTRRCFIARGHHCPPPQPQVRGHSTDATALTPLFAHPRLGTPGWHHGGTQPGHPSAPLIPAAGHWGGVRGGRGQSLDRDGALAEVGLADEGVDEDGVAAAARILRGAEDGVQPLAVRAPHHKAFAPQRFGHRVVICREGTGTRLWHQRDSGGDNGATGHGPNLPAASWPPSAAPSGRCGATRSGSTHPRVTQGHQASPDQGARCPPPVCRGRWGQRSPRYSRPHATLLPSMATCSREIWLQHASLPTKAMMGVCRGQSTGPPRPGDNPERGQNPQFHPPTPRFGAVSPCAAQRCRTLSGCSPASRHRTGPKPGRGRDK